MDDEGDDDPVPLPNVNAAILKKVQDTVATIQACNDYSAHCLFVAVCVCGFFLKIALSIM